MHDNDEFTNERAWIEAGTMRKEQPTAFAPSAAHPTPESTRFLVTWLDYRYETTQPADPAYPNGTAIDKALDAPHACRLELPWPAQRAGLYVVTCKQCGYAIALATAGRADDPRSVKMPCRAL